MRKKESDLISRANAIEYLMTNMGWRDEYGYEVDDANEKRAIITDLINGIPAVDAVPVVRCGECKYMMPDGRCHEFADDCIRPSASDYCSSGERRDSE